MSLPNEVLRKLAKLEALEAGGVDNWEHFDVALEQWRKENHIEDCIDSAISSINDLLVEAEVDEPAGSGCGYSINFNEDTMRAILNKLLAEVKEV